MRFNSTKRRYHLRIAAVWLEKWRWVILAGIGLSLLWVEVQEFLVLRILNQGFHYFEVFQYAVLLISTGLLIELFARSNRAYQQTVRILEYKHRLSLELAAHEEWETLTQKITQIPGSLAEVSETYLLINDSPNGKFERVGYWSAGGDSSTGSGWDPLIPCKKCLERQPADRSSFHLCRNEEDVSSPYVYSLDLRGSMIPTTILKFRLKPGHRLLQEEEQICNSIGDEIIAIMQISQDRRMLSEMQSAQVAMAERRIVSSYVHDQLGQNLGYMQLKLDQISSDGDLKGLETIRNELQRLRDIANESYEIVRDILKKLQPETVPHLTNLLQEQARIVSRRANFTLGFRAIGKPIPLPTNTEQMIFYAFREILSNVEKHAQAEKVDVLVIWDENFLNITVADNGTGFEPGRVDSNEHFGLGIMKERIACIKGQLSVNSITGSGTVVSLSLPLGAGIKVTE